MPAISKIRFTNVIYENGEKRYNDDIFQFDGHNAAILLENGGGKTVYVQTAIQAVLPHAEVAERKIKNTLMLDNNAAHIAIEWILNERPRRYALTAVTLFINKGTVDSLKYVYEYEEGDDGSIENLPFVKTSINANKRPATKEEISEYYSSMSQNRMNAKTFSTIKEYHEFIENNFNIIPSEWRKIALINGAEGGVEAFFDACKNTSQLVDNLLIPVVEEALAGDGTKEFVETFEKQREHFKRYKQLRWRIEESKRVEEQISHYVKVYESYDEVNSRLTELKKNIKSVFKFAEQEKEDTKEKLNANEKSKEMLLREENSCKQKSASYKLALLNQEMLKAEKASSEASDKYNELRSINEERQKRYDILQLSRYKQEIKVQKERIEFHKEQIDRLNEDEDTADINERLQNNSSELKGYYIQEEQKLVSERTVVEGQLKALEEETESYRTELKKLKDSETELANRKNKLEAAKELLIRDMENIEGELLNNKIQDKVEEQYIIWQDRIAELEKAVFDYGKQIKALEEEKQDLIKDLPLLREGLDNLRNEETKLTERLKNIEEEQGKLLLRVKELRSSWFNIDSLYLKQETILQQSENKLEKLREEKESCILNERLANRWLDDYSESEYYTADPSLERWIKSWRNQFSYIESGSEYIERVLKNSEKTKDELDEAYKYWAISVVTSEAEVPKLEDKIKKQSEELIHPVIIMSEKEARDKINGMMTLSGINIFPSNWQKNIVQNSFKEWKDEISIKANESTSARREKEQEFNKWNELLKDIRDFYRECSYEEYIELQKRQKALREKIDFTKKDIDNKDIRIKDIDAEFKKLNTAVSEAKQEQGVLERKILKAQEYKVKKNLKEKNEAEEDKIKEELASNKEQSLKWERRIKLNERAQEDIKEKVGEIKYNIRSMEAEDLYKEVLNATPKSTAVSKEVLKEQRKSLSAALLKLQKGREALEIELKNDMEAEKRLQDELNKFKKQLDYEVNQEMEFPLYGGEEIDRLLEDLRLAKEPLKKLKKDFEDADSAYNNCKLTYELRKKDFYDEYEEIISFTEALEQIPKKLKEEQKDINKRKEYIVKEKERLDEELKDIEEVINTFRIQNGRFSFLSEEINEIEISEDSRQEFPYKRKAFASEMIDRIEEISKLLEEKRSKIEEQKSIFIKFCDSEIVDVRLKEMAVTGVEHKKSFMDILEWQKKMNERILRTIEIAENDIREHDKEVQQFINHLHSYLITMSQELKLIPRKTRIKVEDDWKEVFIFNVPDWDEKEGKEELGKHMDWMLKQLEGDQFRDENGVELEENIRKAIEKWLQSKQLLQIVMKENNIKIKCRKVTNDGKVSSVPFSWEVSNSWSGGEKWSKNMTLFLGILNYLAEKKKQIAAAHKRYRTVIVDNPFGKASSDHVLDPVFFIAEQLGFQIIALTAHAEGKFIRTYFPIVYSCRLRETDNGSSQIMTKEREIKKAFFRDSDPQALLRLGQLQQLGLFDYQELK